ncbi:MAG: acyloxyacyl hydrolase [Gammaproteobacteria bacterium]|nr:MAG: acyloxyacyl hydrolase [Gammaproteobacteria bacterium]
MHRTRIFLIIIFLLFPVSFVYTDVGAEESGVRSPKRMVGAYMGQIGIDDDLEEPEIGGIEYRMLPFSKWDLIPTIGFFYKEGGASYTYIDLRYDYWLSDEWILVPSYGAGYYDKDEEIDLGGDLEFKASLEFSRRFSNDYRLGLVIFHLSHGKLNGNDNPGTEAVALLLSIPLGD